MRGTCGEVGGGRSRVDTDAASRRAGVVRGGRGGRWPGVGVSFHPVGRLDAVRGDLAARRTMSLFVFRAEGGSS